MTNLATHIYVLSDGEKYYVGKADKVNSRYRAHLRNSFNPDHREYRLRKSQWIRSYGSKEEARKYIKIIRVTKVPYELWEQKEINEIAYYRQAYGEENVMNTTDGGDGGPNISGEDHYASHIKDEEIEFIKSRTDLSPMELAGMFDTTPKYIRKIRRGESRVNEGTILDKQTYYPKRCGEDNSNSKLTWYDVFLFRMNFKPYGTGKSSREYALKRLNISYQVSSGIYHNKGWCDENWDPQTRTYTGPPQNWEESWGDWR